MPARQAAQYQRALEKLPEERRQGLSQKDFAFALVDSIFADI